MNFYIVLTEDPKNTKQFFASNANFEFLIWNIVYYRNCPKGIPEINGLVIA